MADISIIKVNNVDYNIKDAVARAAIGDGGNIPTALAAKVGYADYRTTTTGSGNNAVTEHYIYFWKDKTTADGVNGKPSDSQILCKIDAADFVKDGMVTSVAINNGNLVITWNDPDSVIQNNPTTIPLTDIFNPANYYDKTAADAKYLTDVSFDTTNGKFQKTKNGTTSDVVALDSTPTSGSKKPVTSGGVHTALDGKANKSEMSVTAGTGDNADKTTIQLKDGTSATVLTSHQDISGKEDKAVELNSWLTTNFSNFPTTEEDARVPTNEEYSLLINSGQITNWYSGGSNSAIPCSYDNNLTHPIWSFVYGIGESLYVTTIRFVEVGSTHKMWLSRTTEPIALEGGIPNELADLTADSTHMVVTDAQISAWNNKYSKPSGGIPKTDLASAVQTSLGKADSAIQGVKVNGTELTPDSNKKVDVTVPTALANLSADRTHRLVTDTEKAAWNAKQAALTFDNVPTQSSNNPVKSGGVYSALADIYDGYDSSTETISFTFPVVS